MIIDKGNSVECGFQNVTIDTLLKNLKNLESSLNALNGKKYFSFQELETGNKDYLDYLKSNISELMKNLQSINATNTTSKKPDPNCMSSTTLELADDYFPERLDYKAAGIIENKVYNQGTCGACWAFSLSGMISAQEALASRKRPRSFSNQQLLDCVPQASCSGSNHINALQYLLNNTFYVENDYEPYTERKNTCTIPKNNSNGLKGFVKNFIVHKSVTMQQMKFLLLKGPVPVAVDANQFEFVFYGGGVLKYICDEPNHSVLLIGYGQRRDNKIPYWIIKNSWGEDWGIKGTAYLRMEENWDACGMYSDVLELL